MHQTTTPPNRTPGLQRVILEQLDSLRSDSHPSGSVATQKLPHLQLRLTVETVENLACSFQRIVVSEVEQQSREAAEVRQRLERTTEQLDYLPERFRLWEFDPLTMQGLLRSWPLSPAALPSYYELKWQPDGGSFERYSVEPHAGRRATPFALTRDITVRLLTDLAQLWS